MKQKDLNRIAVEILRSNIYLTLATTDGKLPWAAPVFYKMDNYFNFYFISQENSLHIQHILKIPNVAFAIFDSHQPEGEGNGVQGSGVVRLLKGKEIIEGLKYYSTTFISLTPESLSPPAPYRLFQLKTEHFFILDPESKVDKRVEVFIKPSKGYLNSRYFNGLIS